MSSLSRKAKVLWARRKSAEVILLHPDDEFLTSFLAFFGFGATLEETVSSGIGNSAKLSINPSRVAVEYYRPGWPVPSPAEMKNIKKRNAPPLIRKQRKNKTTGFSTKIRKTTQEGC